MHIFIKRIKKNYVFIVLGIILLFTAFVRFYQIEGIPEGFAIDEAAFGYNAYSLLETGRDEYGKFLPANLRSFDDYKGALYSYYTAPFIAIFGLNEFAVRAPSAVIAILLVLISYFLVFKLTKRNDLSLLTAALMSICPILIFLGRIQSDPLLAVFLILLGILTFIKWVEDKKYLYLFSSLILFILSIDAYMSPRVFLPLFLPILFIYYIKKIDKKRKLIAIFHFIILLFFVSFFVLFGGARVGQTSIFTNPEVKLVLEESIREAGTDTPVLITRVFNNKPIYFTRALVENYFSYLDFKFLFFQADSPVREVVKNSGFLYLIDLPFLIFGIFQIFKRKERWGYLAISWILITPLVLSPFSIESPNMHRFILAVFPLQLVTAFGILNFIKLFEKRNYSYLIIILLLIGIYFASFTYYMYHLFVHQPVHKPWSRDHPHKQLLLELKNLEDNYEKIIVSKGGTDMYIFYLFYNKVDPEKYHSYVIGKTDAASVFGKYEFIDKDCTLSAGKEGVGKFEADENILYVNNGTCVTPKYNINYIKTIRWGDNSPAFKLMEYKKGIEEVKEDLPY